MVQNAKGKTALSMGGIPTCMHLHYSLAVLLKFSGSCYVIIHLCICTVSVLLPHHQSFLDGLHPKLKRHPKAVKIQTPQVNKEHQVGKNGNQTVRLKKIL